MKTLLALPLACLLASCAMPLMPMGQTNSLADVVVPFQMQGGAPHVLATINGRGTIPLLLDTGATVSVFEPDAATGCGLLPSGGSRMQIVGVHGSTSASRAVMSTLDIGQWHAINVPCLVRGISSVRPDGLGTTILGMDHIRRHCSFMTIDYRRNCVELGFSRPFQPTSSGVTRSPMGWRNGMPIIRVTSGGISWDAVVDSGSCWGIVIDQSTAAQLGHPHDGMGMGPGLILSGVGGSVRADQVGARTIQVPSISLGGETLQGPILYVMPGPKRIGSRFWQGTRITLDFRAGAFWLER